MINKELEFCELTKVWSVLLSLHGSDPGVQVSKWPVDMTIS